MCDSISQTIGTVAIFIDKAGSPSAECEIKDLYGAMKPWPKDCRTERSRGKRMDTDVDGKIGKGRKGRRKGRKGRSIGGKDEEAQLPEIRITLYAL